MAGAPQEAAADVPQSHAATDHWWEDVSETQRPRELPVYVPISRVTGNAMYNSLPVVALRFAARNRGLSAVGEKLILVQRLQENDLAPAAEHVSDTQPPQQLPLYVPMSQETRNVMYHAFPELALTQPLRNVARNMGLSPVGAHAALLQRLEFDDVGIDAENRLVRDGGYVFSRATGAVMYPEMTIEALQEVASNQQLSHTDRTQQELVQMLERSRSARFQHSHRHHNRISNVWGSRCGTLANSSNKSGSLCRRRNGLTYTRFGNG